MIIKIITPPSSVHASGFIKDTLRWLIVQAEKTNKMFQVKSSDLVEAIRNQKKYAQKEVADFFKDFNNPINITPEECEVAV